ncbi:peptidylprolyl isomerase [Rhodoplanes sp. TEM]|uniref:Peptidylprolyl isomerase n=1 Tax=Rhodoplanes tepidamans TaxID=200616 RepID=A0ABT5JHW0_RHOTP|nr:MULTISPECIES: peptidylprolyl isomerase [Rhodoplanes]MDC7788988.1 peptidylprolyl isomerase [Rhodoplanes tepidamans]MDC7986379.1 peptidylprolyl isomerase [Rhodoplanes sp. TEM]MDQ0355701.1 peptidyl-prolyl cis-trans isomerase SurA [Rhodoplanes tepidamans]
MARNRPARTRLTLVLGALAGALAITLADGTVAPVAAQTVVVMVNGDPITSFDIDQRQKFTTLVTRKTPGRQEVVEELIDERIKIHAGRRYRLDISDSDVDSSFADMAKRMRMTPEQLTATLANSGVQAGTLKSRIRADITWQQLVRGKYQSSFQFRDRDVLAAAEAKRKGDEPVADKIAATEYVLRPILFVVPKGGAADQRRRDAEALRARFDSCDTGLPFARHLREVAVREQIVKTSTDLPPALREILDKTGVGRLTSPETTPNGIEMFAVCAKREVKVDAPVLKEVRAQLFTDTFQAKSKKLLAELRRSAMIERK